RGGQRGRRRGWRGRRRRGRGRRRVRRCARGGLGRRAFGDRRVVGYAVVSSVVLAVRPLGAARRRSYIGERGHRHEQDGGQKRGEGEEAYRPTLADLSEITERSRPGRQR